MSAGGYSDISDFLEEKSGGGLSHGSAGFSLSPEQALKKIRDFNFAHPHHWILALIQGCHAAPRPLPSRIELVGRHDRITVTIRGLHLDLVRELKEVVTALTSLTPALEAFRRALWGLLNVARVKIIQNGSYLLWTGEDFTEGQGEGGKDLTWELILRPESEWYQREGARALAFLKLEEILQESAWFGAIPIFADGRPLERHPGLGGTSSYSPLVLAEGEYGEEMGKLFKTQWNEKRLQYSRPLFTFHHGAEGDYLGFYSVVDKSRADGQKFVFQVGASQRVLVKHGVVIHREILGRSRVFFRMVHVDDDANTDITGLAARVGDGSDLFKKARLKRKFIEHTWRKMFETLRTSRGLIDGLNAIARVQGSLNDKQESKIRNVAGGYTVTVGACLLAPKFLLAVPFVVGWSALYLLSDLHRPVSDLGTNLSLAIEETSSLYAP